MCQLGGHQSDHFYVMNKAFNFSLKELRLKFSQSRAISLFKIPSQNVFFFNSIVRKVNDMFFMGKYKYQPIFITKKSTKVCLSKFYICNKFQQVELLSVLPVIDMVTQSMSKMY